LEPPQLAPKDVSNGGVKGRERLVEEEEIRRAAQSLGQTHPLSLPSGELGGIPVLQALEAKVR